MGGEIYIDGRFETVENLILALPLNLPMSTRVSLDTETCGLYVDGNWATDKSKCAPPGRISVVSLAWRYENGQLSTLAIPFDQGRRGGKAGKHIVDKTFEELPHIDTCQWPNDLCVCTPWDFGQEEWRALGGWLQGRPLVMHHAKFDCHMLAMGLRRFSQVIPEYMDQVVWDTQLAQMIIDPLESSGLKQSMRRLFGEQEGEEKALVEAKLKKNGVGLTRRYDLLEWHDIAAYAAMDAGQTLRLAEWQWAAIVAGEVDAQDAGLIEHELKVAKLLYKMERRGVGLDSQGMRDEAVKMRDEIAVLEKQLPFGPPNITGAKQWFFDELKLEPLKRSSICEHCKGHMDPYTKVKKPKALDPKCRHRGAPSLDAECVAYFVSQGARGAEDWAHIANLHSAVNKWYAAWPNKVGNDERIRTNFRQGRIESDRKGATSGGAISGRFSAERVQLQGVPKEYRIPPGIRPVKEFFQARRGYELWELDLSNAEIRVAAWLSRCKPLADRINTGANIHDENTKALFHIEPDHPEWDMYRTIAKNTIFGDLYGAGVRKLQETIVGATKKEFSLSKVKQFKEALKDAYPELSKTSRLCAMKADVSQGGCGYVRLVNGRKRVFGWGEKLYKAYNAAIQGGVAEVMKEWMLAVEEEYPGILLSQVHDSLWLEIPDLGVPTRIENVKRLGTKIFESRFSTDNIPLMFTVDAKRIA